MRISVLIIVSLALNLALAVVWLNRPHGPAGQSGGGPAENSARSAGEQTSSLNVSGGTAVERRVPVVVGKFSWQELTAPGLKEFLRKLRAVNCPEPTAQDLILAELNRRFQAKTRAFWADNQDWQTQADFWRPYQRKRDLEQARKNQERFRAQREAQKEKTALIVELFGFDVEKQRMKEEGYDPENNWNYGGRELSFVPESRREAASKYLEDFQWKMQEFYTANQGDYGPEYRAKQKQLEAEKLAGLAQFLTPQEGREYELRNSQTAQQIATDLHGVDITRAQYEAMFDIQKKYGDSIYNFGDASNTPEQVKQVEQNKKAMLAEIAQALGTDKAAELERAQDYSYQQLRGLARRNDLPADTAAKVYDFKQAAEKAAELLKAGSDLSPEQRQAALAQIRSETEASVKAALGDKIFKRYQSNGGWWINNLAPAPRQAPQ